MNDQILRVKVRAFPVGAQSDWEECREEYPRLIANSLKETMVEELAEIWNRYGCITHLEFRLDRTVYSRIKEANKSPSDPEARRKEAKEFVDSLNG